MISTVNATTATVTVRPDSITTMIGQTVLIDQLHEMLIGRRLRGEVPAHCLLYGPAGLGKTSIARLISEFTGTTLHCTSPSALTRQSLSTLLAGLGEGDVLFIDEVHGLKRLARAVAVALWSDRTVVAWSDRHPESVRTFGFGLPG